MPSVIAQQILGLPGALIGVPPMLPPVGPGAPSVTPTPAPVPVPADPSADAFWSEFWRGLLHPGDPPTVTEYGPGTGAAAVTRPLTAAELPGAVTPGPFCFGGEAAFCQRLSGIPFLGTGGPQACVVAANGLCLLLAVAVLGAILFVGVRGLTGE